jgi:chromatin-remodeling ATPase INO80
MKFLDKLLG